ncbi:Y4bD/Y4pK family protein [Dehalococcoidia bacterium]|nr:Y4bD/Y4pK family protein [Dehalococcoidia bacterium]
MGGVFRVVHPFHPLYGQEFELITYRNNWGEERVFFHDSGGRLRSMPASWTSVAAPHPFVAMAAGRALFRVEDLLALVALLRRLEGGREISGDRAMV